MFKNYRLKIVLPVVFKMYERIMQKLILQYINKHLSSHLCRYRKGYSTENAVISILQKWKLFTDKKGFAGGVLIDLSKAFDKKNHYY